jgi:hypothetical protein
MSALLCGIDQINKAALFLHKAQGMPERNILDIIMIIKGI